MKKILLAMMFVLITQLTAQENMHETNSKYYVVVKALNILGDKVQHGEATLDGDNSYGFGIDFGYRLQKGFSLEYDFSYSTNTVHEYVEGEEPRSADASYMTHAIDLVYGYEIMHKLELFAKVGYEYEREKISDFEIDNGSDGAVVGAGIEYEIGHAYKVLGEYEHSTIDGPRGDSLYLGLMYNF